MLRLFGWILMIGSVLGGIGELLSIEFPTARFPFTLSREIGLLNTELSSGKVFAWFGWLVAVITFGLGLWLAIRFSHGVKFTPLTLRRIERFKSIKRGYYSLIFIGFLAAVAAFDHVLVGNEALIVSHEGKWSFPAFSRSVERGAQYGLVDDAGESPPNYRTLREDFREADEGNWVLMPPIPYAPTGDTVSAVATPLDVEDDLVMLGGEPFSGLAVKVYDPRQPERMQVRFRYRNGLKDGPVDGWALNGDRVYGAEYAEGELVAGSDSWNGSGTLEEFLAVESSPLCQVHFPPSPPSMAFGSRHPLGTTSRGYDVLAFLYGGLQVNFKAALVYIPLVYAIGVSVGLLMGFFGGVFDLTVQRVIEMLSNVPFLFVVNDQSLVFSPSL